MKLFEWRSNALSAYAPGYLIAVGDSIGQAKENIRHQFKYEFSELFIHLDENYEEDQERINEIWVALENDLSYDPEIYSTGHAFLIRGSD